MRYFHAAVGFPVRDTWLRAIKTGNFKTWPGLTHANASKYCPSSDATIKGDMTQGRQGMRSTKPRALRPRLRPQPPEPDLPTEASNELHIRVEHVSHLYLDYCGRFPIKSRSGNQYIMIAYHCDANVIITAPFKTRADKHRLEAYNDIMLRLKTHGFHTDLQILDNEASAEYKKLMTERWGFKYQLVPPHMNQRNAAERAIRTFKAHFLAIWAGTATDFPKYLWDLLLPQAEMTLNFLRNVTIDQSVLAWEYYAGPFDYNTTPLGTLGGRVIFHNKPSNRAS